jgi:hypothetical protein
MWERDVERNEIERIAEVKVKAAIADLRAEILPKLARIEERIIGIDGNGTGREGAIQRLDTKVDGIAGDVSLLVANESTVRGALVQRQEDKAAAWWRQPIAIALVVALVEGIAKVIEHKGGW